MLDYFKQMLVLAIPAAIVFACFGPYRKRALNAQRLHSGFLREMGLILFVMSLFGVLAVTLRPDFAEVNKDGLWGDILLLTGRPSPEYNTNFIPFRTFSIYVYTMIHGDIFFTILNFLGNLCVFVPLGFFPALLFRGGSWVRSTWIGFAVSFLVEVGQYFIGRASDIDDVILNTLGALCGYWLYLLVQRLWPKFTAKFRLKGK